MLDGEILAESDGFVVFVARSLLEFSQDVAKTQCRDDLVLFACSDRIPQLLVAREPNGVARAVGESRCECASRDTVPAQVSRHTNERGVIRFRRETAERAPNDV